MTNIKLRDFNKHVITHYDDKLHNSTLSHAKVINPSVCIFVVSYISDMKI